MKAILSGETKGTGYQPLEPGIFTGTSAGAINAAIMVSHSEKGSARALACLEQIWVNEFSENTGRGGNGLFHVRLDPLRHLNLERLMANPLLPLASLADDIAALGLAFVRRGADLLLSTGSAESRAVELFDLADFIASERLGETLRRLIDLESIRSADRKLRIAATNWSTGTVRIFANQDMCGDDGYAAIRASAAIPGIFPPVTIRGTEYVDGGLVMNTPLKTALECGASTVHIVYLDPDIRNIPAMRLEGTLGILERSLAISFAAKANQDVMIAGWINEGLRLSRPDLAPGAGYDKAKRALVRTKAAGKGDEYRKVTIHRYHPRGDLAGRLGLLDFDQTAIRTLLERGYEDGIRHDCALSECVIPG